jgi:O-antigen ligase
MMAFAVFLAALNCYKAVTATARIGWGVFALLASFNILFMVLGRTGYAILIVLLTWLAWVLPVRYMRLRGKRWGWRQVLATVFGFLFFIAVIFSVSSRLQNRVELVVSESQAWQTRQARSTSTGDRLDFYYNTLKIVQQHPVFGVGVGGFSAAFAHQVEGKDVLKTSNPHNEYLMISAQTGLVGLIFLLHLFYTQWRYAPLLTATFEQDAARGLVLAYMVNCAFNSALLDHSDGLFFAFMTAVLFAGLKPEKKDA